MYARSLARPPWSYIGALRALATWSILVSACRMGYPLRVDGVQDLCARATAHLPAHTYTPNSSPAAQDTMYAQHTWPTGKVVKGEDTAARFLHFPCHVLPTYRMFCIMRGLTHSPRQPWLLLVFELVHPWLTIEAVPNCTHPTATCHALPLLCLLADTSRQRTSVHHSGNLSSSALMNLCL